MRLAKEKLNRFIRTADGVVGADGAGKQYPVLVKVGSRARGVAARFSTQEMEEFLCIAKNELGSGDYNEEVHNAPQQYFDFEAKPSIFGDELLFKDIGCTQLEGITDDPDNATKRKELEITMPKQVLDFMIKNPSVKIGYNANLGLGNEGISLRLTERVRPGWKAGVVLWGGGEKIHGYWETESGTARYFIEVNL